MDFPSSSRFSSTSDYGYTAQHLPGHVDGLISLNAFRLEECVQMSHRISQFCESGLSLIPQAERDCMSDQDKEVIKLLVKIAVTNFSHFSSLEFTSERKKIRFDEVIEDGDKKVRLIVCTARPLFLARHSTLHKLRESIGENISRNTEAYLQCGVSMGDIADFFLASLSDEGGDIAPHNLQSEEPVFGGKMSDVYKVTYKNGTVYFSKEIQKAKGHISAAMLSGIPASYNRFAERSMFSYVVSELFGFHIIPKTQFALDSVGESVYIQEAVTGQPGENCFLDLYHKGQLFSRILLNAAIVRQLIELQLLDALTGQVDRHMNNMHIDLETSSVFGIDNDACGGYLATHPHKYIPACRMDGYLPSKLTGDEKALVNFLRSQGADDPVLAISKTTVAGRSVFLPPVMDTNMVIKFKKLSGDDLSVLMLKFHFKIQEINAAVLRLKAIHQHIDVLEQRQARGVHSIIDPCDWSSAETRVRLIPALRGAGNALLAFSSYIHRDIALITQQIDYDQPEFVEEAFHAQKHYGWLGNNRRS